MQTEETGTLRGKRLGQDAGQAITEAAIGMSLMAFAWCLMFVAVYMVNNAGRCAVASRHAAWSKGNAVEVTVESLRDEVFLGHEDLVKLEEGSGAGGSNSDQLSIDSMFDFIQNMFPDIQKADVTFGTENEEIPESWPFMFMNTQYPFMPESKVLSLLSVSSHSEWDSVSETWDDFGDLLEDVIGGLFESIGSFP